MFIKNPYLLAGVGMDDNVDAAEKFYVCTMELKKRVSRVLIMPGIVCLFCESETWPRDVASNPLRISVTCQKTKLSS